MFQENVLLSRYSNYKIGGPAKYFFEAKSVEKIIKAVEMAQKMRVPVFVLGGGTNVLFSDEGFNGLILKPNVQFIKKEGDLIRIGAGVSLNKLVEETAESGLSDLEWAAGIPGTLGGAIRGNAGAFGGEIKDVIREVISLDISGSRPKIIKRNNQDCKFNYRSSIFKRRPFSKFGTSEIIIEAALILKKGNKKTIQEIIKRNIEYRWEKQPLEYPSLGSTFKNVRFANLHKRKYSRIFANKFAPISDGMIPAAYLISGAGLNGVSRGGVMISKKHPNFIVNFSNAKAVDVKNLIKLVKKEVYKKFKIKLEEEIEILV